jgi:hypothetical protein
MLTMLTPTALIGVKHGLRMLLLEALKSTAWTIRRELRN